MRFLIVTILLFNFSAFSQNNSLEKIDSICSAYDFLISASLEDDMDFYPPRFTITSTLMERAIGKVNTTTTIYFDKHELEPDDFDNPMDYGVIRKVMVSIQSGSYLITKSFYFNEKGLNIKENGVINGEKFGMQKYFWNKNTTNF